MSRIIVIGSTNTDMVIKSRKLPAPGETILGGTFMMNQGGKGANQAVAASRLGANVTFVTKIGNDMFGKESLASFKNEGIETGSIVTDEKNPSGVALINVDEKGENCIVVAQGANGNLTISDLDEGLFTKDNSDILLMQLEIPIKTVEYAALAAAGKGIKVILNPAPAAALSDDLLKCLYCITPNETEAEILTGIKVFSIETAYKAALNLYNKGVSNVIVTMGSSGAYLLNSDFSGMISAPAVRAIDTTAAGDVFNGALAVALSQNKKISDAVSFANKAASISVTRMGAQASAPFINELS